MSTDKPVSLYAQILAEVQDNILSGAWPPGYRIPAETQMAADYGVSRMTVNKALTQLSREGYLIRRRKGGTEVARPRGQSAVMRITDIADEVRATGARHDFKLLAAERGRAGALDHDLWPEAPRDAPVRALSYVHWADERPFCHEYRLINLATVPEAGQADFATEHAGKWLLREVPWSQAEHLIRAVTPAHEIVQQFGRDATTGPCLEITRRTALEGRPVTFVRLTYPADMHQLVASFAPQNMGGPT